MLRNALGLVETKGLVGAIVATDAAAKASAVVVSSAELTDAAFMTIKIEGELGAVQAAVKAAAEAAQKIGELIAVHVIPRPDAGLAAIVPSRRYISKYHPEDSRPSLDDGVVEKPRPKPKRERGEKKDAGITLQRLQGMTVADLRQLARTIADFPLKGREISAANKTQLIEAIKNLLNLEG
jgi:ethanolamine utilization protein EutM